MSFPPKPAGYNILTRVIQKLIIPEDQCRLKPLQLTGFEFGPSVALRLSKSRVRGTMLFDFTNLLNPMQPNARRGELRSERQRHRRVHSIWSESCDRLPWHS